MAGVIVIGGANVDVKGRTGEAFVGGTSNIGEVEVTAGGVARNIAENLARLGVEAALMAHVGDDANGRMVVEACRAAGVETGLIETCDAPTGVYLAILDAHGEMVAAVNDMRAADAMTVAHLETKADQLAAAAMLVADCNMPVASLAWLCGFAADKGVRLVIEPISNAKARKLLAFARKSPVFAVTPNLQQLGELTGIAETGAAIQRLHGLGFANVVVHCGRDGALVSDGRAPLVAVPACQASDIADVTGAGDAAVAGLVCGLAEGRALAEAARMGQAAAALKLRSRKSVSDAVSRARVLELAELPGG
jgi:pseudouridine kinase